MVAVNSALVAVFAHNVHVTHHSITCIIIEIAIACKRVVVSSKGILKLLCLALPVWHEGVELVEFVCWCVL